MSSGTCNYAFWCVLWCSLRFCHHYHHHHHYLLVSGPSSPRNVQALPLSVSAVQVRWLPPENSNGGIIKYIVEYQPVGQGSPHPWVDTDDGNKTTKDVTALNASTVYQFRVRAFSKVPGEWSKFVRAMTQGDGKKRLHFSLTAEAVHYWCSSRSSFG